jgi:hypothetical protein
MEFIITIEITAELKGWEIPDFQDDCVNPIPQTRTIIVQLPLDAFLSLRLGPAVEAAVQQAVSTIVDAMEDCNDADPA